MQPIHPIKFEKLSENEFIYATRVNRGELVNCFFAFCIWRETLISAHRRHLIVEQGDLEANTVPYVSDIIFSSWKINCDSLIQIKEVNIGPGNDPRIVANGSNFFIIYRGKLGDANDYYLYSSEIGTSIPLIMESKWLHHGKNWAPFVHEEKLYAVHGFDPFMILEIDAKTGKCRVTKRVFSDFPAKTRHDNFSIFRGGSNAVVVDGSIFGFGHATLAEHLHYPFLWLAEIPPQALKVQFTTGEYRRPGFNICDPTSLFIEKNKLWMGLCYSERDWFYEQNFINVLTAQNLKSDMPIDWQLLSASLHSKKERVAFSKIYTANDFRTNVVFEAIPYNARLFKNPRGLISFGPYEFIPSGKYSLKFRYSSRSRLLSKKDRLAINICEQNNPRQVFMAPLPATGGITTRIQFEIELQFGIDQVFECCIESHSTEFIVFDLQLALLEEFDA